MSNRSRVTDWDRKTPEQWRELVTRDLDGLDDRISGAVKDIREDIGEVKEQQKWILRTMWALLVMLLVIAAGIVTSVVFP